MLKIRKSKKDDLIELSKIYKRAYDRPEEGEDWSIKDSKNLLNFYLNQKTFLGITAIINNKIVGAFFSYVKPWYDGNHLGEGEIFIDPKYQKQKIGTKLFWEMMKIADKKKCVVHELIAYNKVSIWYKNLGIKETGLKHMQGNIKEIIRNLEK